MLCFTVFGLAGYFVRNQEQLIVLRFLVYALGVVVIWLAPETKGKELG